MCCNEGSVIKVDRQCHITLQNLKQVLPIKITHVIQVPPKWAFLGETGCSFQTHVLLFWHSVSSCWDCSSPRERKSGHCHPLHQSPGTEQTQGKGQAPDLCLGPRGALRDHWLSWLMACIPQQVWAPGECSDFSGSGPQVSAQSPVALVAGIPQQEAQERGFVSQVPP